MSRRLGLSVGAVSRRPALPVGSAVTALGAALSIAGTVHATLNCRQLRRPPAEPPIVAERVSVLLPVRNEAARVAACLTSLLAQRSVPLLEVLLLDDGSTDGTAGIAAAAAGGDPRVRILPGTPPPAGWLGKPHACAQLARRASGSVLVFVDADVVLEPAAVAASVALLRTAGLSLVSPYPRQLAISPAERLVQPLLQWSWLTTLPLALAERSRRPSLSAANGQLLCVDADCYRRAGGHGAVRGQVLDDLALAREIKSAGGTGGFADGTSLATCRMYTSWNSLRDGYSKSLWAAWGSPAGAAAACALLFLAYVIPPVAALRGSRIGAAGYAAAVIGRVVTGRRTGARVVPDALAHPLSVLALCWLTARSVLLNRAGRLTWKGRLLP